MSDSDTRVTFILYRKGRTRIVSQKEWEEDWLRWWERNYSRQQS